MSEIKSTKEDDEEAERKHFCKVISAFKFYRLHSLRRVVQSEKYFNEIPQHHQTIVSNFREHLATVRTCLEHNYEIIKLMIADTEHLFENKTSAVELNGIVKGATEFEMDKVKSTLKQVARDWSADGANERAACYAPVIETLLQVLPIQHGETKTVLVPGAGLGRLAYEIARRGYACQGNEFSLFMLIASNFILNKCRDVNIFTLYPWVHQYCNNMSEADQVQPIRFPDCNPADISPDVNFSMAAGDFLEVYDEADIWDCVATVFFIDTAHDIVAYVETIWKILKPNGYWINMGPLLYHFADMPNEASIELSYDQLRNVIKQMNFEIIKEETGLPARYTQNPKSMLRYEYDCVFFVARKIVPAEMPTES